MKSALVKNKFSICCVNCQSICARRLCKIEELRLIVGISNVDVVCASETWLNDNVDDSILAIDGYEIVRHDRVGRLGGGVLIYIKKGMIYNLILKSNNLCGVANTEFIAIEFTIQNEKLLLTALYNPPDVECIETLDNLLSLYGSAYRNLVFLGDFNTNLLVNSPTSIRLQSVLSTYSLHCSGTEPTFFHNHGASQLDLILTNDASKVLRFNQIEAPVLSNHDLVFASLDFDYKVSPKSFEFRDYNAVQVDPLINVFYAADWRSFYSSNDSNQQLEFLNSLLTDLHNTFVPIRTVRSKRNINPWFNSAISTAMVDRDLLYARWKCFKSSDDLLAFKRARNKVNMLIRSAKQIYYASKFDNNLSSKELWKNVKMLGINSSENQNIVNFSADEINNNFRKHFTRNNTAIEGSCETIPIEREYFYFNRISESEVVIAMNSIQSNALGLDMLPIKFLKSICPILIEPITHLFNSIITTSVFPDAWKKSKIVPIKKKTNLNTLDNLRPISILCALSKVFEKVIKSDICDYLNRHNLLNQNQSGYRPKRSTKTAMIKIIDDIGIVIDNGRPVVLILLDFSKAFDTVSHAILCHKLKTQFTFSDHAAYLIKSYLTSRSQAVFSNGSLSEFVVIESGVPQGSILGPILFSLYINDLPSVVKKCEIHLFADDAQIYYACLTNSIEEINQDINEDLRRIHEWSRKNMLTLNARKTNAIFISNNSSLNTLKPLLKLNGESIAFVQSATSLGIRIESNFEWENHVTAQCGKIYASLRTLTRTSSFLSIATKLKLFKGLIFPYFIACDFLLDSISAFTFNKLKVALNACVRYVFNLNRYSSVSQLQHLLIGCRFENFSKFRCCLLLHKISSTRQPDYLHNKLKIGRSNRFKKYILPRYHTSKYGNTFFVRGVVHWNSLPTNLSNENSLIAFKRGCREHFK